MPGFPQRYRASVRTIRAANAVGGCSPIYACLTTASGFYAVRGLNLTPNKRLGIDVSSMSGLVIHDIWPAKVAMQDWRNAPDSVDECADEVHMSHSNSITGTSTRVVRASLTCWMALMIDSVAVPLFDVRQWRTLHSSHCATALTKNPHSCHDAAIAVTESDESPCFSHRAIRA